LNLVALVFVINKSDIVLKIQIVLRFIVKTTKDIKFVDILKGLIASTSVSWIYELVIFDIGYFKLVKYSWLISFSSKNV